MQWPQLCADITTKMLAHRMWTRQTTEARPYQLHNTLPHRQFSVEQHDEVMIYDRHWLNFTPINHNTFVLTQSSSVLSALRRSRFVAHRSHLWDYQSSITRSSVMVGGPAWRHQTACDNVFRQAGRKFETSSAFVEYAELQTLQFSILNENLPE